MLKQKKILMICLLLFALFLLWNNKTYVSAFNGQKENMVFLLDQPVTAMVTDYDVQVSVLKVLQGDVDFLQKLKNFNFDVKLSNGSIPEISSIYVYLDNDLVTEEDYLECLVFLGFEKRVVTFVYSDINKIIVEYSTLDDLEVVNKAHIGFNDLME